MKKNLLKFFMFAVLGMFITITACKDYAEDIKRLDGDLASLKTQITDTKNDLKTLEGKVTELKSDLDKAKENLDKCATKDELKKAIDDVVATTVKLDVFEKFKKETNDALEALQKKVADLEKNSATKEELNAFKAEVATKLGEINATLTNLGADLKSLTDRYNAFIGTFDGTIADVIQQIADLKAELSPRIAALETVLKMQPDGSSEVLDDIYAKIKANADEIKAVKEDLAAKYQELVDADKELQRQITENRGEIDKLKERMKKAEEEIDKLKERMKKAEEAIELNITNILMVSRQLKGLTFIPTRGLPAEKTMKFYYFAGDYTADHVLMYRVNPSNAKLGRDYTVESLNYQITTRSAADGVDDGSEKVDIRFNGDPTQIGDILYVPVHIKSEKACEVFGNIDWWGNDYFTLENDAYGWGSVLDENNFPAHVVKTVKNPQVSYENGIGDKGLSLVLTALTKSVEEKDGKKTATENVYVKSSEMMNTYLVPTQIKLAESKKKGNLNVEENLTRRLLKFTLKEATDWANLNENSLPNENKNWNVLAWSGNQGEGGVWTPGKIDLNEWVTSFFYPQDGGDLSRKDVVPGDPHRSLYMEFGKEFGKPYTDKPKYAKPVYKFEQMIYKDAIHNIVIGPEGGEGVTHFYATIEDGHFLTVINTPDKIQGIRNKKLIIKVTQVNSDCEERQPVGYLVLKYTDSPEGIWPDVSYTIDLKEFPYWHKECRSNNNDSRWVYKNYGETSAGAGQPNIIDLYNPYPGSGTMYTTRDGNLDYFTCNRWMNPINAPGSYGLSGKINPGDVNVILAANLQLNGIGEHNMGNIYNIQLRDASVVPGSVKFKAADNNHVNDADNKAATGVTPEGAFKHVMIRYEYKHHSYIVYVDDHAPAGDYEITYLLENKESNTQHGNRLFLTFKFSVRLRDITVEHDKNTVNWLDDNTIRVQHTRIHNSTHTHSKFKSDEGYRVDLKEAFILDNGTINITTNTLPAIGGVDAGNAPHYRPKFEFIQDAGIKGAGFTYVRDANNYLTRIEYEGNLAARIENDPADGFNYLYITYSKEGDLLYNYLMGNMYANNDMANHNTWTKWGKTELMLKDDMERLLPVRMVTDINGDCSWPEDVQIQNPVPGLDYDRFPNGNYYYIDDFNIKFERALRWAFTTVELTDDQQFQFAPFDFYTKDEENNIYRGLFDHAYYGENPPAGHVDHGYGNLVAPQLSWWNWVPYTFTNPMAQGEFYGLEEGPLFLKNFWLPLDPLPIAANQLPIWPLHPDWLPTLPLEYRGIAYNLVEISTDGGATWQPAPQDYFVQDHNRRYFNIITIPYTDPGSGTYFEVTTAIWQGNQTAITSPLYFRLPVTNITADDNGLNDQEKKEYWMSFRAGYAKVKGYAVFKINPRQ